MPRKSKRQRWTASELAHLRSYVLSKSAPLRLSLYQNLVEGSIKHKKSPRFFIEMSHLVARTPNQCKSKFQKMERDIYTAFLGVPARHYDLYARLRQLNSRIKTAHDKKTAPKPQRRALRKTGLLARALQRLGDSGEKTCDSQLEQAGRFDRQIEQLESELGAMRKTVSGLLASGQLEAKFKDPGRF